MHDTHHSQLVAAGADLEKAPTTGEDEGITPLMIALKEGHLEIVKAVGWSCHSQYLDGNKRVKRTE